MIEALKNGETPEKFNYVDEKLFSSVPGVDAIAMGDKTYKVERDF